MSITSFRVVSSDSAASVANYLSPNATDKAQSERNVSNYFAALSNGSREKTSVTLNTGMAAATGLVTFSSTGPVNDETMTVAGQTITAKTSATPGELEFTRSNTPNTDAVNLAALLNTHASFTGVVTAAVTSTGVVTITAAYAGAIGNAIGLTESMTNTTVSGALLTGGSNGTETSI